MATKFPPIGGHSTFEFTKGSNGILHDIISSALVATKNPDAGLSRGSGRGDPGGGGTSGDPVDPLVTEYLSESRIRFLKGGLSMIFNAWRDVEPTEFSWVYWKMGAEVTTFGAEFTEARIESGYGRYAVGNIFEIVLHDHDEDEADDYVNEYEWGGPYMMAYSPHVMSSGKMSHAKGSLEQGGARATKMFSSIIMKVALV